MAKKPLKSYRDSAESMPRHPIISQTLNRDTLDRVTDIIELLEQMNLQDGMTPKARTGLYWIHCMLVDAVKHVNDGLRDQAPATKRKSHLVKQ